MKESSIAATKIPRPEYPRPQFVRQTWTNLNGNWTYEFDFARSGLEQGYQNARGFASNILVPFCPESELSGVGRKDFIEAMWYHRKLEVPVDWSGNSILLHFGGVDFESEVFIDGKSVGTHFGGSASFSYDISAYVTCGETHELVLRVADFRRSGTQPSGKQSDKHHSYACCYTRTTGIWQTVWMEPVSPQGLKSAHIVPDVDGSRFLITPQFRNVRRGCTIKASVKEGDRSIAHTTGSASNGATLVLPVDNPILWSPQDPHLYDIDLEVVDADGATIDSVNSYAGLRKIHIEGNKVFLNNEPVYQRLVLDQGFYPDGLWTAPSDDALKRDIELSMACGFNGARLHQKIFEERFHYWADKLGYLTWAESASWGGDMNKIETARNFISEWEELVVRDRNHPSIIAWTPFNESWERDHDNPKQHDRLTHDLYRLTHNLDATRPVNDISGNFHVITDLWTVHCYIQEPERFRKYLEARNGRVVQYKLMEAWMNEPDKVEKVAEECTWECDYDGQPYLVDEFGGIKWAPQDNVDSQTESWGYGDGPKSIDAFYERLEGLINAILERDHIVGYCYTQLTDVEQEKNGLYFYDRSEKFDMGRLRKILGRNPS
jgi:beta-galactosidase/beta-glucuronidase